MSSSSSSTSTSSLSSSSSDSSLIEPLSIEAIQALPPMTQHKEVVSSSVNQVRTNDWTTTIDRSTPAGESSHCSGFDWVDHKVARCYWNTNDVGTKRELNRTGSSTKLNVISIEAYGFRMECTLFGNYVDELNAFLSRGELQNVIISVQFAKTRMIENTDSPTQGLSQLCDSRKQNAEDEFINLIHINIIQGLKDCREESTYVVLATIKHIVADDDWWYTACLCSKVVYPNSKMFFCEKCNKHVIKVQQRYKLKVRVNDDTNSTTFVLFDRDATTLINKSCAELFESYDKNADSGVLHKEFDLLIDKVVLFKLDIMFESTDLGALSDTINESDRNLVQRFSAEQIQ
ncbi:replication protein A 70 kDa DNA-binding subunit C-like [Phaseolus vulgaris]|uniref:replication protein A 70 kDa DNA-binding subunit C-like n=1 Tax=Phaseolus vulgaris TaxID=3885 RepID=UPI0035CB655B